MSKKIRIAIVGLGFGSAFVEIYAQHPDVADVGLCDSDPTKLARFDAQRFPHRHHDLAEVLRGDRYDAVHLFLPVTWHTEPTLAALAAGKHVACAVPMAHRLEDLERIIAAQEKTGLNYMMMETMIYGREYFFAKDLYRAGKLGRIQFLRGCHSQDLEDINPVWRGLPPMWYMTHAVSALLDILDTQAAQVCCLGSGQMRAEFTKPYGNPYPIETAIFVLRGTAARAEVTRTLFETAPWGDEGFDIYGEHGTYVTIGHSPPVLSTIAPLQGTGERRQLNYGQGMGELPFRPDLLPAALVPFAQGGHSGSHPHLVNEFIRSIVEARQPYVHARRAANWCAAGICAHESAMRDGAKVPVPLF